MIARELLVKLGFDIDETKFNRFNKNVEALKANLASIKSKVGINIDAGQLNRFKNQVDQVKAKVADVQGKVGLNVDDKKLHSFKKQVEAVKARISNVQGKFALKFSLDSLNNIDSKIKSTKAQMIELRKQINHRMYPEIDTKALATYRKELASLTKEQRKEVEALNKAEKDATRDQLKLLRAKYAQIQAVNNKLNETQRKFREAARIAKSAHSTFSRFFTRFAAIGIGSGLLAIRSTLKDAKDFKAGGGKTNNYFSPEQLGTVHRFNVSLLQLKKTLGELRNKFVVGLLPAFKDNIDALNNWLLKNKELINTKISKFLETLTTAFKALTAVGKTIFAVLNPIVDLIGGWGVVLSGFIGAGILSWLVRLALFLKSAGTAIAVFSTAIRALTVALVSNPIVALITAITAALVLIADEFIVTAKGGDSLINRFGGLKKIGESFIETLKEMWHWLVKVGEDMLDFTGITALKELVTGSDKQKPEQPSHSILAKALVPNISEYGKLDTTRSINERFKFTPPSYNYHNSLAKNNNAKTINHTNNSKPTFNFNINVPSGTSEEQSRVITKEVRKQIQSELDWHNEKTKNAIGSF